MEKITNQKVNKFGRDIAFRLMKKNSNINLKRGTHNDYFCDEDKSYPIYYWTKTHQTRKLNGEEFKVTGKDLDRMEEVKKIAQKQGDVFLVWIDALLGVVMGDRYSNLMKPFQEGNIVFPYTELTHKGGILYFSVYQIQTISQVDEDELNDLRSLIARNRTPKGQISLL